MKQLAWILAAFFGLVFLGATFLNAGLVAESRSALSGGALRDRSRFPETRYHLLALIPDTDDSFFSGLLAGIEGEAPGAQVAVQVVSYPRSQSAEAERWFDIAVRAEIDGLIMYVPRGEPLAARQAEAAANGLVFVPVGKDLPPGDISCFIGSASLSQGYEAGSLIAARLGSAARIGVILPESGLGETGDDDPLLRGISAAIRAMPGASIIGVTRSRPGILSGEESAAELLASPGLNAIICVNSRDSLGAAQVVVDRNLVGKVLIVGADETPELLRYIDKGVVAASIVRDSRRIGQEAVRTFGRMKAGQPPPGAIETGFVVRMPGGGR